MKKPGRCTRLTMRSRLLIIGVASILAFVLSSCAASRGSSPQALAKNINDTQSPVPVFYSGPQDGLYKGLLLYEGFSLVEDPAQAQVFVFNGDIPDIDEIASQLQAGAGLVLVLGPDLAAQDVEALIGGGTSLKTFGPPLQNAVSLVVAPEETDPLLTEIAWNSAPQVRDRYLLESLDGGINPLVVTYENGDMVLGELQSGTKQDFLLTIFLGQSNTQFQEWAYFNYLVYSVTLRAAGGIPLAFADYKGSPVPHEVERTTLYILLAGLLLTVILIFISVRRYSRAHPEELDALVIDRKEFEDRQEHTEWEQVGFHRPLGGFLLALMFGLVLFIPTIVYQNLILPVYILPSAQALGIWGRVVQFFNFLWLFLDMGTSAAFIKFFSQYRVHEPRKAIQYGQVFVWWQAISGAIQVAVVIALAGTFLPRTVYAIYAWSVIIHTFIQIPGFYQVMRHSMMAWQRFDYAQVLDLGLALIFPIITQPIIVSLMVMLGRSHPRFGPAMGGLLGLGLAAYAAEALTFLVGLWLYRRLGYNARLLFLAHFDLKTIISALRFGVFEMLGSVAWAVGQAMEIVITQARLVNYTEIWGNWVLAQNFVFAFQVIGTLTGNTMPALSEAISNARRALSQYYATMAYKWGGLISAFIAAVLLAVADRFILGASGPEFSRAALYSIPLVIWGAIQYLSWVGDEVQLASNRPYLKSALVFSEQVIRTVLAWLLLERLQINALIIAYFVGLLTKSIAAYIINHRVCFPQRFYFWQSLAAPLLAGGVHFLIIRWITGLIWAGDQITSVLIFLIGILISYPLYAFLYGLAGGWDDDTLAELQDATTLSNFMRPMARLFWRATAFGAHLSPLHNRFPIQIRQAAMQEAQSLTSERIRI